MCDDKTRRISTLTLASQSRLACIVRKTLLIAYFAEDDTLKYKPICPPKTMMDDEDEIEDLEIEDD